MQFLFSEKHLKGSVLVHCSVATSNRYLISGLGTNASAAPSHPTVAEDGHADVALRCREELTSTQHLTLTQYATSVFVERLQIVNTLFDLVSTPGRLIDIEYYRLSYWKRLLSHPQGRICRRRIISSQSQGKPNKPISPL